MKNASKAYCRNRIPNRLFQIIVLLFSINITDAQTLEFTEKYINDKIVNCDVYRPGGGIGVVPLHGVYMDSSGIINGYHRGKIFYTLKINPEEVYYLFQDDCTELGATSQLIKIKCNSKAGYSCISTLWSGTNIYGNSVYNQSGSEDYVVIHFNLSPSSFDAIKLALEKYFQIARDRYEMYQKGLALEDPFLDKVLKEKEIIPLIKNNGVYEVPVTLNGLIKLDFILDSGAGDVFISPEVLLTLYRGKTISKSDFIGEYTYEFANGKKEKCKVYLLKKVQIGTTTISNVKCAVANTIVGSMLLGQSFLERLGKYTIDYNKAQIVIH
jgi:hypothetical protein